MLVGLGLRLLHLGFAHLRTGNRVFDKALPARQITSVEHGNKACLLGKACEELFEGISIIASVFSVEERKYFIQDGAEFRAVVFLVIARDVPYRVCGGGANRSIPVIQEFGGIHEGEEGACLLDILQYSHLLIACAGDFHGFAQAQKSVFGREGGVGDERDVSRDSLIEDVGRRSRLANLEERLGSLRTLPLEEGSEGGVLNNGSVVLQTLENHVESLLFARCG